MDRRVIGALLLVAALTLALVIPALDGLRLAGVGTTIELPREPRAGDCLLPSRADEAATVGASPASLGPTFAACDGRIVAGEVVAVARTEGNLSTGREEAASSGMDCRRMVLEYSGLVLEDGRPLSAIRYPADPISWNLALNVRAALLVPSPVLSSAGQRWVACVAAPVGDAHFQGRLAEAFTGGTLPSEFGVCVSQRKPSVFVDPVPCQGPHVSELLSTATVPGSGRTPNADIKDSCLRIAVMVVGRSDPTAAGQLFVETSISPAAAQFLALPQPLDVACYISSVARPLAGTLVGLGDRPIPFSP